MRRMILARHGETTGNVEDRCQGQADIPLTQAGRQQAARLARQMASDLPPGTLSAVITSDLSRAYDTAAAIVAAYGDVLLIPDPRLREQSKGVWDGLTWDDIRTLRAAEYAAWQADPDTPPPGGETFSDTVARIRACLDDLHRDYPGKTVLVVAHGAVLRMLICLALGIDPAFAWNFHIGNTGLSDVRFDPEGAVLHRLNDTSHLTPALKRGANARNA